MNVCIRQFTCSTSKANIVIERMVREWITRNDKREKEEGDSETLHLDDVQSFFNTGDEDADDNVADADISLSLTTAALYCSSFAPLYWLNNHKKSSNNWRQCVTAEHHYTPKSYRFRCRCSIRASMTVRSFKLAVVGYTATDAVDQQL